MIVNYGSIRSLEIKNLVADWKRLLIAYILCDERLAKTLHQQNSGSGRKSGYLVMKYGFDYENLDSLYSILVGEQIGYGV